MLISNTQNFISRNSYKPLDLSIMFQNSENGFKGILCEISLRKGNEIDINEKIYGLIDTGATYSCLSQRLVEKYGLKSKYTFPSGSANGPGLSNLYNLIINISHLNNENFFVEAGDYNNSTKEGFQKHDMLIGCDILKQTTLYISGQNNYFFWKCGHLPVYDSEGNSL